MLSGAVPGGLGAATLPLLAPPRRLRSRASVGRGNGGASVAPTTVVAAVAGVVPVFRPFRLVVGVRILRGRVSAPRSESRCSLPKRRKRLKRENQEKGLWQQQTHMIRQ